MKWKSRKNFNKKNICSSQISLSMHFFFSFRMSNYEQSKSIIKLSSAFYAQNIVLLTAQRTSLSYENYWILRFDTLLHRKDDMQITFDSKLNIVRCKILSKQFVNRNFHKQSSTYFHIILNIFSCLFCSLNGALYEHNFLNFFHSIHSITIK